MIIQKVSKNLSGSLKSPGRKAVPVQVRPRAPTRLYPINGGWHSLHPVDNTVPATMGQHSQSVILEVSKTIRSA